MISPAYYTVKRKRVITTRKVVQALKEATPCTDCHVKYPYYVMQYDHLHSKSDAVCKLVNGASLKKVLAEIEKCELVCANCHSVRSYKRKFPKPD